MITISRLLSIIRSKSPLGETFKQRNFFLLWVGLTVSGIGDSIWSIAIAWYALKTTDSAAALSAVLVASMVPQIIFQLFGGIVVDRWPRRTVLIATDLIRLCIVLCIAVLASLNRLPFWCLLLVSAALGLAGTLYNPALKALIPGIVERNELLRSTNALLSLAKNITRFIGPPLGGVIIALAGTSTAFLINGFSFAGSAIAVWFMHGYREQPQIMEAAARRLTFSHYFAEIGAGFRAIWSMPWIRVTLIFSMFANVVLFGPLFVGLPVLIERHFDNPRVLGLINFIDGAGGFIITLWLAHQKEIPHRGFVAYGAVFLAGAGLLFFGVMATQHLIIFGILGAFLLSAGIVIFSIIWDTTLQEMVPQELMGRVFSIDYFVSSTLIPISYFVIGFALQRIPTQLVFFFSGAMVLAITGGMMLTKPIRSMK